MNLANIPLKIGIIGDFDPQRRSHTATNEALQHSANALSVTLDIAWLATQELEDGFSEMRLERFHALWCAPGSPYTSMSGALKGIRFSREHEIPFLGTWGGFQHTLVEYAQHVLGIQETPFEESTPDASTPFISQLSCSLVGEKQSVTIIPDTLTFQAYGQEKVVEQFNCNYGLNEEYRDEIAQGDLNIVGVDTHGAVRIVELRTHRFFIATLFLPQLSSSPDNPHPLIMAYIKAAEERIRRDTSSLS